MGLMKTLTLTVALATLANAVPCLEVPPAWPTQFEVQGVLVVPSAQVEEPLHAWYDSVAGNSKIDYYEGTSSIYQMSYFPTRNGSYSLVVPVTTENYVNQKTCMRWSGNGDVWPLSIVPDLGGYKCQGDDIINGVKAQKWTYTVVVNVESLNYTMWINWIKDEKTGKNVPVPVFYEVDGTDYYNIKYSNFKIGAPEQSIWEDLRTLKCAPSGPAEISFQTGSDPAETVLQYHELHMNSAWSHFLHIRSKRFGAVPEHTMRKSTFRKNYKLVITHNSGKHNYKLALNQFADWTKEEMQGLRARFQSKQKVGSSPFPYQQNEIIRMSEALPESLDWRVKGAVTQVKNQFDCGSGWSFATTGAIEGANFVKTGKLNSLSEQALIDCSWGFSNGGCNGGSEQNGYQWVLKHGGLPLEVEYPYLSMNGKCHFNNTELHAPIKGWANVPEHNENALKVALFKNGPVSVAINSDPATFMFYASGVYDDTSCKSDSLDHSALAVGYGVKNGQQYWIIKNSWSTYWGDEGYMLISAKNNICGVTTDASVVMM